MEPWIWVISIIVLVLVIVVVSGIKVVPQSKTKRIPIRERSIQLLKAQSLKSTKLSKMTL